MFISSGLLLALVLIALFILISAILDKLGILEKYGFELSGPLLIWSTKKGRELIDRMAKKSKKFWEYYGSFGIIVVGICMVIMMILMIWSAYLASSIPSNQAPSPRLVIGVPGVNPLIPIWYGIAGLALSIIIHEFSHGILARVAEIKIKSLGIAMLIVPIGAFVEPDEDEMEALTKKKRKRIYAVGPTTNVILAVVLVLLFSSVFMGSLTPKHDGVIVNGVAANSPAERAGIDEGIEMTSINGTRITDKEQLSSMNIDPVERVDVEALKEGREKDYSILSGLVVTATVSDYPAQEAGLKSGDVIVSLDNETVKNYDSFDEVIKEKGAGDDVQITYWRRGEGNETVSMTLVDKYESFEELYPSENKESYKDQGYMGVGLSYLGISTWNVEYIPQLLSQPFKDADSVGDYFMSSLQYISIPFMNLSPMPDDIAGLYAIQGPLSAMPVPIFWITANLLYWVFWLNLMVGLFNALPAVPLDGGHIFRDWTSSIVERFDVGEEKEEKIINGISYVIALSILGLLMWQLIGPRI